jgi:succinate dehydrogenase/fumarate reductase cytochrome b subunit
MLTQTSRVLLRKYGFAIGILVGVGLLAVFAGPALAQDLSDGVSTATSSFKSIIKTVFAIAAIVVVVGGLLLTAWKFTQRDPNALGYLVGTIAAGAICGIVSGML